VFVEIPNGALIYAVAGLVIFAGLTMFDFQRLRRTADIRSAPLLAASIFLDVLNVFSLFLTLFSRGEQHGQGHDQWLARVRRMPVGETVSPCASHIAGATEQQ
jgi:hypothetical protein